MARKPNYKFERLERQRAKAAKKAARLEAKKEKAEKRKAENAGLVLADDGFVGSPGNMKDLYWRFDGQWNNWGNEAAALLSAEYLVRRGLTGDVSGGRAGTLADLIANLGQTVKNAR